MSDIHDVMPAAKTILAIDLGEFKSAARVLDVPSGTHRFETIPTILVAMHDLLVTVAPGRLVIEPCSVAGWVHDLAVAVSIPVQVANTNGEAWHYKRVKRKTDRDDALKLTKVRRRGGYRRSWRCRGRSWSGAGRCCGTGPSGPTRRRPPDRRARRRRREGGTPDNDR
jgi:hypothetical protein